MLSSYNGGLFVYLLPLAYSNYKNEEYFVIWFINYSVIANSYPVSVLYPFSFLQPAGLGIAAKR